MWAFKAIDFLNFFTITRNHIFGFYHISIPRIWFRIPHSHLHNCLIRPSKIFSGTYFYHPDLGLLLVFRNFRIMQRLRVFLNHIHDSTIQICPVTAKSNCHLEIIQLPSLSAGKWFSVLILVDYFHVAHNQTPSFPNMASS